MEKKCDGKVRFQLVSEVNRAGREVRCTGEVRLCGSPFFKLFSLLVNGK